MFRLSFSIIMIILGFFLPSWLFLTALFIMGFFVRNFWEAILVTGIVNLAYVYSGASFEGVYLLWGLAVFAFSWFIHTRTRFKKEEIL